MLLVPHGQAIMRGLMTGMGSQMPALRNQVGQVTAALMPGGALTAGGAAARGGAGTSIGDIHLTVNGFVGNQQELMQALYYQFQKIVLQQDRRNVTNGLSLAHP